MPVKTSPTSKKQPSEKQLRANRANAARSTGPRTAEGKARAAQNSRRHGFAADAFTVHRLEDADAVACLRADLLRVYRPVNSQELFAVERIAIAQNALLRIARLETGILSNALHHAVDDEGAFLHQPSIGLCEPVDMTFAQSFNHGLADGYFRVAAQSDAFKLFLRYQAQAERNYRRAIEEFDRLKALRDELPNEPVSEPEPEPAQPLTDPPDEPVSPPANPAPAVPLLIPTPPLLSSTPVAPPLNDTLP